MPASFSRLILFRPRPEFPLPPEWGRRPWIPLGDLRPMLQAVSPVRDLSDIWRWVALPLPRAEVEAALATLIGVTLRRDGSDGEDPQEHEQCAARVCAVLIPAEVEASVERIELLMPGGHLLGAPAPDAVATMLDAAMALNRACGCVAVGMG